MILKQNITSHLKALSFTLWVTAILFVCWPYFDYDVEYLKIVGIIQLINFSPALYLHIEYTHRNWGESISVAHDRIHIIKRGKETIYGMNDIQKVVIVKSASLDKGGIPLTAIESYYYYRILMKSGEEIILTCILGPHFEELPKMFKGVTHERIKKFFCSIDPI